MARPHLVHGVSSGRPVNHLRLMIELEFRSTRHIDQDLLEAMKAVASERRRFGYRHIHVMLQRSGSQ